MDTSTHSSASDSGTSTASTNPNPADPSAPSATTAPTAPVAPTAPTAPTSSTSSSGATASTPPSEGDGAQKGGRKKRRLSRAATLDAQANAVEKEAAGSTDPIVEEDLKRLEHEQEHAKKVTDATPISETELKDLREERSASLGRLGQTLGNLVKVISIRPVGKAFVKRWKGKGVANTARSMVEHMVPEVLGHNGPVFDELKEALADYDRVDAEYNADQKSFSESESASTLALNRLAAAISVLTYSLKRSASLNALEHMRASKAK